MASVEFPSRAYPQRRSPLTRTSPRRLRLGPGPLFVAPAIIMLIGVLIVPILTVLNSSVRVDGNLSGHITLRNYGEIFGEFGFSRTFVNTMVFTISSVVLHVVVGLPIALLLNCEVPCRKFFRIVTAIPWMLSSVVVAITWRWLYDAQFGVINDILRRLGLLTTLVDILGNPFLAMPAVLLANLWRGFPFITIIVLAALQSIPEEQYDAAAVDGATAVQAFTHVTLPNITYALLLAATLDAIFNFKYFDLIQVMTAGGPAGRTEVLTTLIYRSAFEAFDMGHATAMAGLMFVVSLGFALAYAWLVMRNA